MSQGTRSRLRSAVALLRKVRPPLGRWQQLTTADNGRAGTIFAGNNYRCQTRPGPRDVSAKIYQILTAHSALATIALYLALTRAAQRHSALPPRTRIDCRIIEQCERERSAVPPRKSLKSATHTDFDTSRSLYSENSFWGYSYFDSYAAQFNWKEQTYNYALHTQSSSPSVIAISNILRRLRVKCAQRQQ